MTTEQTDQTPETEQPEQDQLEDTTEQPEDQPAPDDAEQENTEQDEEQATDESKAGREAAKYRRRLRETEAELETSRTTIDAMKANALAQHVAAHGMAGPSKNANLPKLLKAEGIAIADLVADDGTIDTKALGTVFEQINTAYGTTFALVHIPGPKKRNTTTGGVDWSHLLKNARK